MIDGYTTVATLKAHLGIEGTGEDLLLERLIKTVTKQFDKYLGFSLVETTYKQYLTVYTDCVIVDYGPVNEVGIILKKLSPTGDDISIVRIDEHIIYIDEIYNDIAYVEYKAGYTDLEDIIDVEQACLEMCTATYNDRPSSGTETDVKSKKVDVLTKTYFSKKELSEGIQMNFREVLDNYKPDIYNPLRT